MHQSLLTLRRALIHLNLCLENDCTSLREAEKIQEILVPGKVAFYSDGTGLMWSGDLINWTSSTLCCSFADVLSMQNRTSFVRSKKSKEQADFEGVRTS